jgi:hypothetical protein
MIKFWTSTATLDHGGVPAGRMKSSGNIVGKWERDRK